ncbi:GH25 family lysozyme [Clostridium beijerinckii]|uniref:GH25 family lysozyme n=1 Tax=Clostridium beijerinckii TaxID=1520 RepID=UPI00098CE12A|nr:GH25 family lysozyme [Clostridium beijerinckii]MBA8937779.1 GH25 family lysozyme M1 (1,4-beta-N-acetylmuramidase) [Clostridium beijerinckii]NRU41605.1 GH25 family lysozyme M1 (1,4-beta-N-acetylmuramidase) [Clostridium beijerinckii]NRU41664.1 GH25 family lysozyme M1 (1,4-beta-N-acetylmuramidase) [Clostridium beijerinckii]NSB00851.1 GH25 family lysozyme M1 (1,4-beta-N-acetylmuramidase) [Clostridium beijerinckii]OOM65769.1 autolytic lysozyme [Clostridium beijerinckii]
MKGIDVSNYDGNINFNQVKAADIEAVYIKATEGTTFTDSYLTTNYSNAHYAGLRTGFYHFLVGTSSPETQANSFYNAIKDKASDLIPMLDIETNFNGLMDYILRFIAKFKELSNMQIGIYTYTSFMDNLDNRIADYPLWEANYNNTPWKLNSNFFTNRVGHQYSETGSVPGINTDCDMNEFNEGVLNKTTGYVRTNYLPIGYRGDGSFAGVDMEYVQEYFKDIRIYANSNDKGIWVETQILPIEKCYELKNTLGSWFYDIK